MKEKNPAYGSTLIRIFSVLVWTISIPRENALKPADRGFTSDFSAPESYRDLRKTSASSLKNLK